MQHALFVHEFINLFNKINSLIQLDKISPWEYQEQVSSRCYPQVAVTLLSVKFAVGK